ncbi:3-deoxy-D-manno-octulosonic acid transferase [Thalassotalea euphylliae]|uniref:3-deoxy-D-manno-octulosonic acid transferase n=1 Tax=Thalassotalea euphylliae TaxID=1655234 RepID=UPI0036453624
MRLLLTIEISALALFCYRLLLLVFLPIILLFAVARSFSQKAYRKRLSERLGMVPNHFQSGGIIIHCASVGEVLALKPYIQACIARFSDLPITVTTFTPTGSAQVQQLFGDQVQHCYFPLDVLPCSAAFLSKLKPKVLVVMETELWPNIVAQAAKRHCKLLLINGRLSDKSWPKYQKLAALIKPCLANFDQVLTQSEQYSERFIALGANASTCHNIGNLKYDLRQTEQALAKQAELENLIDEHKQTLLLASSHAGDEQLVIDAFKSDTLKNEHLRLIVVPRHPERFNEVAQLIKSQGLDLATRGNGDRVTVHTDVWLIDTLGELMSVFPLSDIVIMGGTFSHIGGHNPLEPALFKKPIMLGSDMANFKEVQQQLSKANAAINLPEGIKAEVLAKEIKRLLDDKDLQERIGQSAQAVVIQNQGATEKALSALAVLLRQ